MRELVIYAEDDGGWVVQSDRMPGFIARGKTQGEAIASMKRALTLYYPCVCEPDE